MPIRLESDLEKRACEAAERDGWWALKLVCVGHRGFPDRWFVRKGDERGCYGIPKIIIIEFKAPGKRARKLQKWVCEKLEAIGFEVWWDVSEWEQVVEILDL